MHVSTISVGVQVVRVLATSAHRLAVVESESTRRVTGVVTQSAVTRFLCSHRHLLGELASHNLEGVMTSGVLSVPDTCSVGEALAACLARRVASVCVVDTAGVYVTRFELELIRHLTSVAADRVHDALASGMIAYMSSCDELCATATLRAGDSLGTAVEVLVSSKQHSLFVLDEARRPVGVLSLTDVLKAVAPAREDHRAH